MKFKRTTPEINLEQFLKKAEQVTHFTSTNGKRYQVTAVKNGAMSFLRLDAKTETCWDMDLGAVHRAYLELENFNTISFKRFVPRKHSPARGLLLHLKLLTPEM